MVTESFFSALQVSGKGKKRKLINGGTGREQSGERREERKRENEEDLVNECIMFRDGLLRLPDAFTVGDFTDIMHYLSTC